MPMAERGFRQADGAAASSGDDARWERYQRITDNHGEDGS